MLGGAAIGPSVNSKRGRIESGVYPPNFKLETARKDAALVAGAARDRGLELPLAGLSRDLLAAAERDGLGRLDYSALVAHIRGTPARLPDEAE